MADAFNEFWARFPRKVGKLAAHKAYQRARKTGVTQQQLLDGIERYVTHKPSYADYCHPATWLNQGRWDDEYDAPAVAVRPEVDWYEECQRLHGLRCNGRYGHALQMQADALKVIP